MPRAVVVLTTASLIGLFAATTLRAQSELVEETLSIPKQGLFTVNLEATVFKADGPGPFPLAVINHGMALGNPALQARYRPASAVRYFLQRGYVVVVPMRQGFANSGGLYIDSGCNIESNGRTQADDVLATVAFMSEQPYVDKQRIITA